MGEVVALAEYSKTGWNSGEAHCLTCKHRWVAQAPSGTEWLECPACSSTKGVYRHPCAPEVGQDWYTHHCGGHVFYATPDNLRCYNCGGPVTPWSVR